MIKSETLEQAIPLVNFRAKFIADSLGTYNEKQRTKKLAKLTDPSYMYLKLKQKSVF